MGGAKLEPILGLYCWENDFLRFSKNGQFMQMGYTVGKTKNSTQNDMTSAIQKQVLKLIQMSKNDSEWASRSDEHIFNIILDFLEKKFWSTIFAVRSILRLFKGPLKSLSNDRTAKMVDQNFFPKNFKIMLKICSSELEAHPE